GIPEILADGKDIIDLAATVAGRADSSRLKYRLVCRDCVVVGRNRFYRAWPRRIAFQTVGSAVSRAVIEERVQIWSVEIDSKARTDYQISASLRLKGKSNPRRKILILLWIDRVDSRALENHSALRRQENGQILFVVSEWAFVIP